MPRCAVCREFAPYNKCILPRIICSRAGHTPSATGGDRVDVHDGVRPLRQGLGRAKYAPLRRVRRHGVPRLPAGPGLPRGARPQRPPTVILKRRRTNIPAIREMVNGYSSWARCSRAPFFWAVRDLPIPVRPKIKTLSSRHEKGLFGTQSGCPSPGAGPRKGWPSSRRERAAMGTRDGLPAPRAGLGPVCSAPPTAAVPGPSQRPRNWRRRDRPPRSGYRWRSIRCGRATPGGAGRPGPAHRRTTLEG